MEFVLGWDCVVDICSSVMYLSGVWIGLLKAHVDKISAIH